MNIKICTEMHLSASQLQKAAESAIKENPENKPTALQPMVGVHYSQEKLALLTGKKWAKRRVLGVTFLGGSKLIQ